MYAIIDIETTGGNPYRDKITEVAIFIHDGERVVKEFQTLINPERRIPHFITRMTGISDEMVAQAPKFYEVAKTIVEITENTVFVAHNASFDYNFIKSEFHKLGYFYKRESLCTVKLSRKIFPGKRSYSLGKLCQELDITIKNRHRAMGDALATVKLFELIRKNSPQGFFMEIADKQLVNNPVNPSITKQVIENLPQKTGIYYFLNEQNEIIYIGKSKDIRQRVLSHLSNVRTKKALEMVQKITDIQYEVTGSELIALLRESEEIKHHNPFYNRQQKRTLYNYGLYSYSDQNGYLCLKLAKINNGTIAHTSFSCMEKGKDFLFRLTEKYNLCQNLTGLYATSSACFQYAVDICKGACIGRESPEDYNIRVELALEFAGFEKENMIVLDPGRTEKESAFIIIEKGQYLGYGFVTKDQPLENADDFKIYMTPAVDNRDARQIISGFLRNKRTGKRITY